MWFKWVVIANIAGQIVGRTTSVGKVFKWTAGEAAVSAAINILLIIGLLVYWK